MSVCVSKGMMLFAVLRAERDELLHRDVWGVARARLSLPDDLVARARPADRATQVLLHRTSYETTRQVNRYI